MKNLFVGLFYSLMFIFVIGCGGGGGAKEFTTLSSSRALTEYKVTVSPDIVKQYKFNKDYIVASSYENKNLISNTIKAINGDIISVGEVLDKPILMYYVDGNHKNIELNLESTSIALVMIAIGNTSTNDLVLLKDEIKNHKLFSDLLNELGKNYKFGISDPLNPINSSNVYELTQKIAEGIQSLDKQRSKESRENITGADNDFEVFSNFANQELVVNNPYHLTYAVYAYGKDNSLFDVVPARDGTLKLNGYFPTLDIPTTTIPFSRLGITGQGLEQIYFTRGATGFNYNILSADGQAYMLNLLKGTSILIDSLDKGSKANIGKALLDPDKFKKLSNVVVSIRSGYETVSKTVDKLDDLVIGLQLGIYFYELYNESNSENNEYITQSLGDARHILSVAEQLTNKLAIYSESDLNEKLNAEKKRIAKIILGPTVQIRNDILKKAVREKFKTYTIDDIKKLLKKIGIDFSKTMEELDKINFIYGDDQDFKSFLHKSAIFLKYILKDTQALSVLYDYLNISADNFPKNKIFHGIKGIDFGLTFANKTIPYVYDSFSAPFVMGPITLMDGKIVKTGDIYTASFQIFVNDRLKYTFSEFDFKNSHPKLNFIVGDRVRIESNFYTHDVIDDTGQVGSTSIFDSLNVGSKILMHSYHFKTVYRNKNLSSVENSLLGQDDYFSDSLYVENAFSNQKFTYQYLYSKAYINGSFAYNEYNTETYWIHYDSFIDYEVTPLPSELGGHSPTGYNHIHKSNSFVVKDGLKDFYVYFRNYNFNGSKFFIFDTDTSKITTLNADFDTNIKKTKVIFTPDWRHHGEYIWDFGDNTTIIHSDFGETIVHNYVRTGTYDVTLKVFDKTGLQSGEYTKTIYVTNENTDTFPTVSFYGQTTGFPNDTIQVGVNIENEDTVRDIEWDISPKIPIKVSQNKKYIEFVAPNITQINQRKFFKVKYNVITKEGKEISDVHYVYIQHPDTVTPILKLFDFNQDNNSVKFKVHADSSYTLKYIEYKIYDKNNNKIGITYNEPLNWKHSTKDYTLDISNFTKGAYRVEIIVVNVLNEKSLPINIFFIKMDKETDKPDVIIPVVNNSIVGKVTDSDGQSLANITVKFEYIKDNQNAIVSDVTMPDGTYKIELSKEDFDNFKQGTKLIIYAYGYGYTPTIREIEKTDQTSFNENFIMELIKENEIVLEIEPQLHHLGDGSYSGSQNSDFQRAGAEGTEFQKLFIIDFDKFSKYQKAEITFEAKGMQNYGNKLYINNTSHSLETSPYNGSYATQKIQINKSEYINGENTIRIVSGKGFGTDYDDFEFINIKIKFLDPVDQNIKPIVTDLELSIIENNSKLQIITRYEANNGSKVSYIDWTIISPSGEVVNYAYKLNKIEYSGFARFRFDTFNEESYFSEDGIYTVKTYVKNEDGISSDVSTGAIYVDVPNENIDDLLNEIFGTDTSIDNKTLLQNDHWKAKIVVDTLVTGKKSATIDFRDLNCGGYLTYIAEENGGYKFDETITYGNCLQNCTVWINEAGTYYEETCRNDVVGGNLEVQ